MNVKLGISKVSKLSQSLLIVPLIREPPQYEGKALQAFTASPSAYSSLRVHSKVLVHRHPPTVLAHALAPSL